MSIVTTTRAIDLAQLDEEARRAAGLTTPPGLSMREVGEGDDVERIIRCDHDAVTQTILDDVIDSHVPSPQPQPLEEQVAALKARATAAESTLDEIIIGALMGDFPPTF